MSNKIASNTRGSSAPPHRGRSGSRFLQVALPLALSIFLLSTFLALLVVQSRKSRQEAAPQLALPPGTKIESRSELIPYGSPTDKNPFKPPAGPVPRFGGKFPRWHLASVPEGWNEGIAQALHSYFEELEYNPDKPIDMNRIEKARAELEDYLAQLGPDAIKTLATILDAERDFVDRRMLLKTIGDLGPQSAEATFVLRDFFMARYADPQNRSEMLYVVDSMAKLQNDTSYDMLVDLVDRGNSDPALHRYRDRFIEALGDHPKREEAVPRFVDTMSNDQLEYARNKAAQALGKIASPESLPDLYNAVEKERSWFVKQTMLGSIGKIGDPQSIPFLETQARMGKESSTRLSAAGALRRMGTPESDRILKNLESSEPDPEVRKRIQDWNNGKFPGASKAQQGSGR